MTIYTGYLVIEQYDDGYQEPFGVHLFEKPPQEGDIVTLRLGATTYDVVVRRVSEERLEVIAEPMKDTPR